MFESSGPTQLYKDHQETLKKLCAVGDRLKSRFHDMDQAVDCLMLAALTGEAMVMIGPPGTAKSLLVRDFAELLGLSPGGTEENEAYFEYLLTQFTEPSELFGFYDLAKLNKDNELVRMDANMMQKAQVVFLDEVFNASSAILNALLTFMNERLFHDRGRPIRTNLQLLVSATNQPPSDPTLAAVYDRFLLRCWMHNIARPGMENAELTELARFGWAETNGEHSKPEPGWDTLLTDLEAYRKDVKTMTSQGKLKIDQTHTIFPRFAQAVRGLWDFGLCKVSNRRIVKFTGIMLANRLIRAAQRNESGTIDLDTPDLDVFLKYSLDNDADGSGAEKVRQLVQAK